MKYLLALSIIFTFHLSNAQNPLERFKPLIGNVWKAEGQWGDGSPFKQEIVFKYDLNNSIVIAESKGFIDKERTQFGNRNHGIRKFDEASGDVFFWEFDAFGGLTEGIVTFEGENIIYSYSYQETELVDIWEKVDDNTYKFTVANAKNLEEKYLQATFKSN